VDLSIRTATREDFDEVIRIDGASFAIDYSEADVADVLSVIDLDRFLVAYDGDVLAGVAGDYALTVTVPGGGAIDIPGITWVSVRPTHRRRGVLTALMRHQIGSFAARGEPFTVLTASEGGIYRRFGFGAATLVRRFSLARRLSEMLDPVPSGGVELMSADEAALLLPAIHDRWCAQTPGAVHRSAERWSVLLTDRPGDRDGMTARHFLVHPDGYVGYRLKQEWAYGHPAHVCWITDYVAVTPQAHAALWQVVHGLDLVGTVESLQVPVDDPLPHLLTDSRHVRTLEVNDGMWLRPLDVAATLSARRYDVEIDVVVQVADHLAGDTVGRYHLRGAADGAECSRTDALPDVMLTVDALGAIYLGGHRLTTLVRAGRASRADQFSDRDLNRLSAAFLADREPFHGTAF
jgi:predicted acetyltransferase